MDGRGILWGGNPVVLNGQKGILFPQSTEEEAFQRWQTGDFLGTERSIAKKWRAALAVSDYENRYQFFRQRFLGGKSLKNLHEVKARADEYIDDADRERTFRTGMTLLNILLATLRLVSCGSAGCPCFRASLPPRLVILVTMIFLIGTSVK